MDCIIGRRRQGKSTLAYALAMSYDQSAVVFDPNNQFNALPTIEVEGLDAWLAADNGGAVRIVPSADASQIFGELTGVLDGGAWRWGDYTLIVDEASMLMRPNWLHPSLERYARTAPKDVRVILTTHRPVDIHPLMRGLASDWYIFHQLLSRDIAAIEDQFGQDVATQSTKLPPYHLIHYWTDVGGQPRTEVWDNPDVWYMNIGRTT